ncbi:MAG: TonB family protein [Candidatus Binatia bacterium]
MLLQLIRSAEIQQFAWCWAFSVVLHGMAVGAAFMLVGALTLAPQPEPFRWNVVLVEDPPAEPEATVLESDPGSTAPPAAQTTLVQAQPPVRVPTLQPVDRPSVSASGPVLKGPTHTMIQTSQSVNAPMQPVPSETAASTAATETHPVDSEATVTSVSGRAIPGEQQVMTEAESVLETHSPEIADSVVKETQAQIVLPEPVAEKDNRSKAASSTMGEATIRELPERSNSASRPDYGWLAEMLRSKVEQLKTYPYAARVNRWEGRVVLRMVIGEQGQLLGLDVAESSGHIVLDRAALGTVEQAFPLQLKQVLEQPQVVVLVPIIYRLEP